MTESLHILERRQSDRVAIRVATQVQLDDANPEHPQHQLRHCEGEVVDACCDGRGLGLALPLSSRPALGSEISLRWPTADPVCGIVVSRMGGRQGVRVGVRVHQTSRSRVCALIDAYEDLHNLVLEPI